MTHNIQTLQREVLRMSRSDRWRQAVSEWEVVGLEEDVSAAGVCVCGKTNLRYLYEIYNYDTGHNLLPIGSTCVNMFGVRNLDTSVAVLRRLFDMRKAFEAGEFVDLDTKHFSRAVLQDLRQNNALPPTVYNNGRGEEDYFFLLDMFNRRRAPSVRERGKIRALILNPIQGFVRQDDRLIR